MKPRPLTGDIRVPGDKSISHRALIFAAMAEGESAVTGLGTGTDVSCTAVCLARMGATVELAEGRESARVTGVGGSGFTEPDRVLDCGNSGTAMRLLTGLAAGTAGLSVLTGDSSLSRRPMGRVTEPLRAMGASIDGRDGGALPPLVVRGGRLQGLEHRLRVSSAQVKTSLLLAGMLADGTTTVVEPAPSRDHTERMLRAAGVTLTISGPAVSVRGGQRPQPGSISVPGDISSAFFLIAAAILTPRSDLSIVDVGLNPGRTGGLELLTRMGAPVRWAATGSSAGEPYGTVTVRSAGELSAIDIDGSEVPGAIDELPMLAVLASQAAGTTTIKGAEELRVKESDRIDSVVEGLRTIGGDAEATADGMRITGPTRLTGGIVHAKGDHRIAMAFAVAGMVAAGDVRVQGWRAVDTSFPEFLDLLGRARGRR